MSRSQNLKKFRETSLVTYLENNGVKFDSKIDKGEKVKLCSSDSFTDVAKEFEEKYYGEKGPVMISHVGGFYVTASLAGLANKISASKPYLLFFDRKSANVENAVFNSLLMQVCNYKEDYICALFGLSKIDIIKALNPALCASYIEQILSPKLEELGYKKLNKKDKKQVLKTLYEKDKARIDEEISRKFISKSLVDELLDTEFNMAKIEKYAKSMKYDPASHYELLQQLAKDKLTGKEYATFCSMASDITDYLSRDENYHDLVGYLTADIKINGEHHILANDDIYDGYRSLFNKRGSNVKFVSDIDISTEKGVKKLEEVLTRDGFIGDSVKENEFAVDLAFTPHINELKEAYPFLKKTVQDYIMLYKDSSKKKNYFVGGSTATLHQRTLKSIGAEFIEEERKNRQPLTNLCQIETREGLPPMMFIAGANFGNIYHSEVDTNNMVDMAIANNIDTVYITGLIYSTYYRQQTSRRMLADPTYETLESRLQAAKKLVKRLNNAGIKVVYQMGDEEGYLYQDLHTMYTREMGVKGNNFLRRDDLKSEYDWVRPLIIQDLIPYLIRSGEDIVNFSTDEEHKTNVAKLCHAIKRYKEGLPLGDLAKYIKPEYLKDTDMFRIVYSTIDKYGEGLAVRIETDTNFSKATQYGKPNTGIIKKAAMNAPTEPGKSCELFVDGRQGFMSLVYKSGVDQVVMNVPQMIDDGYYKDPNLLPGIKERIVEDPTRKRITQSYTRPNYPGGWIISGDSRERMTILPYYKRVREVMEYVQKTGKGLPLQVIGNINDWQTGSPTERPDYDVKFMDYLLYACHATGLIIDGDLQQGHNYGEYANESRYLGAASMTQQMISNTKMIRPFIQDGFGVVKGNFESRSNAPGANDSEKIISHLVKEGLIEETLGLYGLIQRIKRDVDYATVDLKLPCELQQYESEIRDKLSKIINLEFVDILEGNHEWNSDWDHKGYNEIELLRQELESLKRYTGSDIDLTLTEFFVNSRGDFVKAPYAFRTINGYNNMYGHCFKPGGKGGGPSPTDGISRWLEQMSGNIPRVDKVNSAHYHIFESSVINNTLITITGGGAGQSGFEQKLSFSSTPVYVIERYMPDGRICIETVGTKFLDEYEIQNPYIKSIGLDKFIQECTTEEAPIFAPKEPEKVQKIYQRTLKARKPNKIIGPNID